jgi:uncharacterized protein YhaN
MSFIDTLRSTNQKLEDWLDGAKATTDVQRSERQAVLEMQRKLNQQIDELALVQAKLAARDVSSYTSQVTALTAQIEATASSIQAAQQVVAAVAEIVAVAAQVIALVAGA